MDAPRCFLLNFYCSRIPVCSRIPFLVERTPSVTLSVRLGLVLHWAARVRSRPKELGFPSRLCCRLRPWVVLDVGFGTRNADPVTKLQLLPKAATSIQSRAMDAYHEMCQRVMAHRGASDIWRTGIGKRPWPTRKRHRSDHSALTDSFVA